MCRPPPTIVIPESMKSEYEIVRQQNIEEREAEFLQIFGYPIDLSDIKY